ncbi:MAG: sulfur-carrier protein [Thermoproteota archaeon]|nr:sulfur-carrier protein [Thermoproteota archaeon]
MRDLTGGQLSVELEAQTLGQLIDVLDDRYPGVRDRLCNKGQLRKDIVAIVDDKEAELGLMQPISESTEVRFLPFMGGG